MGELVALETTQNVEDENPGEDSVDFVAATTAALGVPSPCLSKTSSFQDSPPPAAVELRRLRKGDLEEETELLQALQLSQGKDHGDSAFTFSDASPTGTHCDNIPHLEQFKSDGDKASENERNMIEAKGGDLEHDQLSPKKSGDETVLGVENVNSNEKASSEALSVEKTDLESTKLECTSDSLLKSDATYVNPGSLYSSFYI